MNLKVVVHCHTPYYVKSGSGVQRAKFFRRILTPTLCLEELEEREAPGAEVIPLVTCADFRLALGGAPG
jgi:hypothetical protein